MPVKLSERQRSLTTKLAISRGLGSSPTSEILPQEARGFWHVEDVCPSYALLAGFFGKMDVASVATNYED